MYLKKSYELLINSFRNRNYAVLLPILMDLLFIFISFLIFRFWLFSFRGKMQELQAIDAQSVLSSPESVKAFQPFFAGVLFFVWGSIIFVVVCMLLNYSITRYLSWSIISKSKPSFRHCFKFCLLVLIWLLIFAIPFIISLTPLISYLLAYKGVADRPSAPPSLLAGFFVIVLLFLYFTANSYALFSKTGTIKSLFSSVKASALKIHYLILPWILLFIFLFVINLFVRALPFSNTPKFVIQLLLVLLCLSWHKSYIYDIVKEDLSK